MHALQASLVAPPKTLALAYSGGLDSSVLLDAAAVMAARDGFRLIALHVHHGLSTDADGWLAHCRERCAALGVSFDAECVQLDQGSGQGIEEVARVARYAALGRLCRQHGAQLLLTAHHQDDQAETVLLQLLRGSGLAGMSAMPSGQTAPALLGDADTVIVRPLLGVTRKQIEAYASARQLAHVEDESNANVRYARNALRHRLMPVLEQDFAGYQQRLARTAVHAQNAQQLLQEIAELDLVQCRHEDHLLMPALRRLSEQRFFNLMRHWFGLRGMRMPSLAWMEQMRTQLLTAREESQLCVSHPDGEVHRYRERVYLAPRRVLPDPDEEEPVVLPLPWQGEASLPVPHCYGVLHVEVIDADDSVTPGLDAEWLRAQPLEVRGRSGGERLRLAMNRPARSLKQQYQAADVPAWERPFLPLLFSGRNLLFAAGVGMDCTHLVTLGPRVRLRWQAGTATGQA
ncbi:tRNA lysidine(34) synthetase TilS [Herbaspirillum sp. alder98]|uniref:tRNA lysidine(34) synthetase TilS n=1 Tax=Herbaspirillum sp. alder98 TaxID=2913096 RepID=UPI001CD8BB30|nr:tRNA lysidine(34) synthetase TilS [Herbaspirillum sp. alder98]MCA1322777.1 tRNA lysidine(34) synthetase TilS [Herbaspirillum sp. alder98]